MELEHVIQLPKGCDDALMFTKLFPQYDMLRYGEDGVKLMNKECKSLHLYDYDDDMTLLPDREPTGIEAPLSSSVVPAIVPAGTMACFSPLVSLSRPADCVAPLPYHYDAPLPSRYDAP